MSRKEQPEFDVLEGLVEEAASTKAVNPRRPLQPHPRADAGSVQKATVKLLSEALDYSSGKIRTYKGAFSPAKGVPLKAVYEAFKNLEKAVGGRRKLVETLQYCPEGSPGFGMMQKLLNDPSYVEQMLDEGGEAERYTLAAICKKHKIPFNSIVVGFRDALTARKTIESMMAVSEKVVPAVEQMAQDSLSRWETCNNCEGLGKLARLTETGEPMRDANQQVVMKLCQPCGGKRKVWVEHDFQNRKMFLETMGVARQKAAIETNVQVHNNTLNASFTPGTSTFERLMKAVDSIDNKRDQEFQDVQFEVHPVGDSESRAETSEGTKGAQPERGGGVDGQVGETRATFNA